MLKITGMDSYYGENRVLHGLSLEVPRGEIVGLIGRNGVGKSTTLKSIMGLVRTPCGSIQLDGDELINRPTYERAAAGVGYVPQGRDIFPQMTVQENLELAMYARKKRGKVPDYIYVTANLAAATHFLERSKKMMGQAIRHGRTKFINPPVPPVIIMVLTVTVKNSFVLGSVGITALLSNFSVVTAVSIRQSPPFQNASSTQLYQEAPPKCHR